MIVGIALRRPGLHSPDITAVDRRENILAGLDRLFDARGDLIDLRYQNVITGCLRSEPGRGHAVLAIRQMHGLPALFRCVRADCVVRDLVHPLSNLRQVVQGKPARSEGGVCLSSGVEQRRR